MALKLVVFEDNERDVEAIREIFSIYEPQFLVFDLDSNADVVKARCDAIEEFQPDMVIVDMIKQSASDNEFKEPGLRVLSRLCDASRDNSFPVVAYSVALTDTPEGKERIKLIREYGAAPVPKASLREDGPTAETFFEAIGKWPTSES